jgi:hypothetical protein
MPIESKTPDPDAGGAARRYPAAAPALAALSALLLCQCLFDERTAGTSTSVTNPTVYGAAILLDGKPAAGAVVHLRGGEIELSPDGVPRAKSFAMDTVDDTGGWSLPMPAKRLEEYWLVFDQSPGDPLPSDTLELQVHPWPDGLPHNGYTGTFRLNKPGSLMGRVSFGDTSGDSTRWIGARGTTVFSRLSADGSFRLDRLAPGRHQLSLVTVPVKAALPTDPRPFAVRKLVGSDSVAAGEVRDMGTLFDPES